jgi:hypothetical protein
MFDTPNPAGYPGLGVAMDEQDVARDLVAKLMEAVEASLEGSPAVRDALEELVRKGYEPRLILMADAEARDSDADDSAEAPDDGDEDEPIGDGDATEDDAEGVDLRYELTKPDRDFLRTVRIRPESG